MANREIPRAAALANIQGSSGTSPISYLSPLGKAGAPQAPDPIQMPAKPMAQPFLNDDVKALANFSTSLQKAMAAVVTMDARIANKRATGSSNPLKNIGPATALALISDPNFTADNQQLATFMRRNKIPFVTATDQELTSYGLGGQAAVQVMGDIDTPANFEMHTSLNFDGDLDEIFEAERVNNKFGNTAAQAGFNTQYFELANAYKTKVQNARDKKIQLASLSTTMDTIRQTIRVNTSQINTNEPLDADALSLLQPVFQAFGTTKGFVDRPIDEILIPSVMQAVGTIVETYGIDVGENALNQIMQVRMANDAPWAAPNTKKGDMVSDMFDKLMDEFLKKETTKSKLNENIREKAQLQINQYVSENFLEAAGGEPLSLGEIRKIGEALAEQFPDYPELVAKTRDTLHNRNQNLLESVNDEEARVSAQALDTYRQRLYRGEATLNIEAFSDRIMNDSNLKGKDKEELRKLLTTFRSISGYNTMPEITVFKDVITEAADTYTDTFLNLGGIKIPQQIVDQPELNKIKTQFESKLQQLIFETVNTKVTPLLYNRFGNKALYMKDPNTQLSVIDTLNDAIPQLVTEFQAEVDLRALSKGDTKKITDQLTEYAEALELEVKDFFGGD